MKKEITIELEEETSEKLDLLCRVIAFKNEADYSDNVDQLRNWFIEHLINQTRINIEMEE